MGDKISKVVSQLSIVHQAAGDEESHKQLLVYAYGEYKKINPNIF